jgi:hypothetical protein
MTAAAAAAPTVAITALLVPLSPDGWALAPVDADEGFAT